jgi:hypothetical protein
MKILKYIIFSMLYIGCTLSYVYADTVMFQCRQVNGHTNFTDSPCGAKQKHLSKSILKPMKNMHTVASKYAPDEPIQRYGYAPRDNPFNEIELEKRSQQKREWDSLGPIGVTPFNSPHTYGNTRFAQHH